MNKYHDTVQSLLDQTRTSFVKHNVVQDRYASLLKYYPGIVADILFTNSLVNSKILLKPAVYSLTGAKLNAAYYSNISAISYASESYFPLGSFIHEECHKLMDHIFENGTNPYFKNDATAKLDLKKAIKKILLNIASLYEIPDLENLANLSTWDLGKKLSKFQSSKVDFNTSNTLNKIFAIYNGYGDTKEDKEFIVKIADITADGQYNKIIQQIFVPLEKYWQKHIVPHMFNYQIKHTNTEFCSPLPQLLPEFAFYQQCNLATRKVLPESIIQNKQYSLAHTLISEGAKVSADLFVKLMKLSKNSPECYNLAKLSLETKSIVQGNQDFMDMKTMKLYGFINTAIDHNLHELAKILIEQGSTIFPESFEKLVKLSIKNPQLQELTKLLLEKEAVVSFYDDSMELESYSLEYNYIKLALDNGLYELAEALLQKGTTIIDSDILKKIIELGKITPELDNLHKTMLDQELLLDIEENSICDFMQEANHRGMDEIATIISETSNMCCVKASEITNQYKTLQSDDILL